MKTRSALLVAIGCLTLAPAAAAQTLRYSNTAPGGVVATGNTLGLSKEFGQNGPGIKDSIGTFITLANTVDALPLNLGNPWFSGTTSDWTKNESEAVLSLPSEASVLYAELLWGGSYQYGSEDVLAYLNDPVTLYFGAASLDVAPDGATALTVDGVAATGFLVKYYLRSADVTAFVKTHGTGTYSTAGVPATQDTTINSLNAAGWTLVVAYRDETATTRNLSVFVGGSFVDEASQQDYTVSGFCAPPAGEVQGTALVSTIEGDANLTGDQLLIAPSAAGPFVQLSGPNNPGDNFFCSQLNDANGLLDTQGTFGNKNQDALAGTNIEGGRQGWDVTTVPLSSQAGQLVQSQTSAVLRTITTGDSYMPILAAFAIDINAPDFSASGTTLDASLDQVTIGDSVTFSAAITNTGQVVAQGLTFDLPLAQGLSLVSFSSDGAPGDIGGNAVDGALLGSGVAEGDLAPGQTRKLDIVVSVDAAPASGTFFALGTWSYGYEACANAPLLNETLSQSKALIFNEPPTSATTTTSATTGAGGAGGGSGSGGDISAGAGGNGGAETSAGGSREGDSGAADDGGCGCRVPSEPANDNKALWMGLAAAALLSARRRLRL